MDIFHLGTFLHYIMGTSKNPPLIHPKPLLG
jgi:hypothetical protein